jgi:hypothetical protein
MIKTLLVEWLQASITKEEKPYSRYFTYAFTIIGLILIMVANYIYFCLGDKEIGNFIAFSAIFFICAFIIENFACYLKQRAKYRALTRIKSKGSDLVAFINKQVGKLITIKTLTSFLPLAIRFVPVGIAFFVIRALVKKKLSIK